MFIDFEKLPDNAKIWIYQSNRKLYPNEIPELTAKLSDFLTSWQNNKKDIIASFEIRYNRFIIIGIDQTNDYLTTLAIDMMVNFIFKIQDHYNIQLLDKLNVCFKQGEFVVYKDLIDFQKLVKDKAVTSKTIVFNNLIDTKRELIEDWEIPINESWHKRFL